MKEFIKGTQIGQLPGPIKERVEKPSIYQDDNQLPRVVPKSSDPSKTQETSYTDSVSTPV